MKITGEIVLGVAPTRRNVFSKEDAVRYKELIYKKLDSMGINYAGLDWLNEEGLLYDENDAEKAAEYFRKSSADALFIPHCNFGTEGATAKLARSLHIPVLLWGPRDEAPLEDGSRLRDTQCGLFATSMLLKRYRIPFSYIENCRVGDKCFEDGLGDFLSAACVVKNFRNMKIGQIDTRPTSFYSVIINEGELLEKFGIEIVPITITEIAQKMKTVSAENQSMVSGIVDEFSGRVQCSHIERDKLDKMAALKIVLREWADRNDLSAIAIQCWDALQDETGIMPCFVDSELTGEGLPIVCETDVYGAVTSVVVQSAMRSAAPVFFADLTIRHPDNDNAELLWHCGPFSYALKKEGETAKIGEHYVLDSKCPGVAEWEIKGGDISICRFGESGGEFMILAAEGKGVDGPGTRGTYVWVEFEDWPALERKLIYGPYIHHVACIHGSISRILKEALRYIPGVTFDSPDTVQ